MTRRFLGSIAVLSMLAAVLYGQETQQAAPKKGPQSESNTVYVKIIVPDETVQGGDRSVVESWIAAELAKSGQANFTAATDWVPLAITGEEFEFPTRVWGGGLAGRSLCCPVSGEIAERADGRIQVFFNGWAPVPGHGVTVSLLDEPGSRAVAAVEKMKRENGQPYVAVLIGPPSKKVQ